jgi:hypothetical protein
LVGEEEAVAEDDEGATAVDCLNLFEPRLAEEVED